MTLSRAVLFHSLAITMFLFGVMSCTGTLRKTEIRSNEPVQLSWRLSPDEQRPKTVFVAGSFNDWTMNDPAFKCLWNSQEKAFQISFRLAPGRYEYKFIVDGQWVHDPDARETDIDPLGGKLGVFHVLPQTTP